MNAESQSGFDRWDIAAVAIGVIAVVMGAVHEPSEVEKQQNIVCVLQAAEGLSQQMDSDTLSAVTIAAIGSQRRKRRST